MIVRLTLLLLALQLAAAAGIAYAGFTFMQLSTAASAAMGGGAVLVVRFLITANNFRIAWKHRSETPPSMQISHLQTIRLVLCEYAATMLTSSWLMPFRTFNGVVYPDSETLPVLLVHGYGCNSGYWRPFSRVLKRRRISHYTVNMEPVFADIDSYAQAIHARIEAICGTHRCEKLVVVAHSMGGLAMRAYVRAHGAGHIAKIITLGTPHHGTALANHATGLNAAQMARAGERGAQPVGEWLRRLAGGETAEIRTLVVSVYSHHDNIIAPQDSAFLPGAKNIGMPGIGHVFLALNTAVQATVIDEIMITPRSNASLSDRDCLSAC
ncbi:MAG: alpha/beta fold hydrolase [Paucimonas sp.]|jgi:pimeloyl-ACP methyl ester carboxylesterase|nr:alpha/beta fold hydrolase [Paucimonas sp.]